MVDNCIQVHRCTKDITGWLKGGHPTFKDGIVDREACFHGWQNCCDRIVQIRVRECEGFYVYELNPSPEGRYRYCARGWTVSGPLIRLEELWIVQKGYNVEDVVRAKTTHVNKEMIYPDLAEALNPVSTLSLSLSFFFFFCKKGLRRTSFGYVLDIFTTSYTLRSSSESQGLLVGSGEAARR